MADFGGTAMWITIFGLEAPDEGKIHCISGKSQKVGINKRHQFHLQDRRSTSPLRETDGLTCPSGCLVQVFFFGPFL